jgi:hypothetical protein
MPDPVLDAPISQLRQRLIDDMNMRRFSPETQRNYLRDIGRLAAFLGRSPDTATADDLRRFQIEQQEDGVPVPTARRRNEAGSPHPPRCFPTAVAPSLTSAEIRNPHSRRPWPAGSFLGDFRTPAGARNSSRLQTVWFRAALSG